MPIGSYEKSSENRGTSTPPRLRRAETTSLRALYPYEKDDLDKLTKQVSDTNTDNPWPKRQWAGWDPVEEWDQDRFDFDMATKIEPNLPKEPLFLADYPAPAASLSKLKDSDPRVAERWELYVDGMELANAFTELTDAAEQRRRFEAAREERRTLGEADYPLDEEFLVDLQRMPPAGGVALGVDRLAMLACGASSIDEVRDMVYYRT